MVYTTFLVLFTITAETYCRTTPTPTSIPTPTPIPTPTTTTIELTLSKTILEDTVEIEPQPVAFDFKNLSQYSSRSK